MQHACLTSLVLAGLLCCKKAAAACKNNFRIKTVSTNFFSLKGGEFDLFEFTMLFQTSKTLSKTFGNFQKRKCSPVEKTFCWDCWKTSCTWSWKTTSNFISKRSHQKLIPNSFAVQIASGANEFHRKTKFFSKKLMSNIIIQK